MPKKLQLQVPAPCHENWENMTSTERGRFCASCQKQVIDFSNKSDREIAMFFKRPFTGSVCGRFMEDQLNREIDIPKKRIPWLKYFFQFLIPMFFISYRTTAQGKVKVVANATTHSSELSKSAKIKNLKIARGAWATTVGDTTVQYVPKIDIDPVSKTPQINNASCHVIVGVLLSELETSINGKVVDHSGNPIAFATVAIKGTKIAVAADSAGRFTITPKPGSKKITLSTSCVGFAPTEKTLKRSDWRGDLEIELEQTGTLGEVIVSSFNSHRMGMVGSVKFYRTYPLDIIDTFRLKRNFIIYPNPIRSNSTLTIEYRQNQFGDHLLQLFNQSGQLVFSKELNITEGSKLLTINMPALITGDYFLKLTTASTGRSYTEKLTVE